jgi:Bacterial mobilisation protein (MobC)
MALISLRISDEVAARLSAVAASEGGKSALLRRLIADVLSASPARIAPLPVGRPQKITVRFRESEMRQLAEISNQRGMTRTGWIVALVRSRLGSPVQHSPGEHASLRAIVRELNRIGGNINQIAQAANTSVLQGRAVEPDLSVIREAKTVIELALAQLRGALDGNADYWETRR